MGAVRTIPLEELAADLPHVIEQAELGVSTIVTRNGKPVFRVVPARHEVGAVDPLVAQARVLRTAIAPGESVSDLVHGARRDAGRL